jgi:hypothetical protein
LSSHKEATRQHFQDLYTMEEEEDKENTREMLEHIPSLITEEERTILLHKIEEEEIAQVVWSLYPSPISLSDMLSS